LRFKGARGGNGACGGNLPHAAAKQGDGTSAESTCEKVAVCNTREASFFKFR
jgi:hypothetical protein